MAAPQELAEEYALDDKVRLLATYLAAGAAVVFAAKTWLFPAIAEFARTAPCRQVMGIPAVEVLFHGLFVAMPLVVALVVGATLGRRGRRILRDGQVPPVGEKVFRRTPIHRGTRARLQGYVHLFAAAPLVAMALWGFPQAQKLADLPKDVPPRCAAPASTP